MTKKDEKNKVIVVIGKDRAVGSDVIPVIFSNRRGDIFAVVKIIEEEIIASLTANAELLFVSEENQPTALGAKRQIEELTKLLLAKAVEINFPNRKNTKGEK